MQNAWQEKAMRIRWIYAFGERAKAVNALAERQCVREMEKEFLQNRRMDSNEVCMCF